MVLVAAFDLTKPSSTNSLDFLQGLLPSPRYSSDESREGESLPSTSFQLPLVVLFPFLDQIPDVDVLFIVSSLAI